ncbi:MAG: YigZ family protein [Clostridiales bacterium]|nr:YigZ family protein [Clostridiales bacterium]
MGKNIVIAYKSIKHTANTKEFIINKSRFIGYAKHTMTQSDALEFIKEVNKLHPEASCLCHAYICGMKQEIQKLHDGHEPIGGMPILEMLRLKKLTAVCCVVVRYFGGVKLGKGVLARAFSNAASEAINLAQPCTYELSKKVLLVIDYPYQGKMEYMLSNSSFKKGRTEFDAKVNIELSYKLSKEEEFISTISGITNGTHQLKELETYYDYWEE